MPAIRSLVIAFAVFPMLAGTAVHSRAEIADRAVTRAFLTLLAGEAGDKARAAELIEAQWEPSFLPMAIEVIRLTRSAEVSAALVGVMERETGAAHGHDLVAWQREMWNAPEARHPRYAAFKSALYSLIDPRFSAYFDTAGNALIRLDEIVWGGVRQDGIPPLRDPAMLDPEEAGYLEDDHIVFGLSGIWLTLSSKVEGPLSVPYSLIRKKTMGGVSLAWRCWDRSADRAHAARLGA